MERTNFEKLQVYKLSEELSDGIWHLVLGWHQVAKDTIGKQIIRSADSIGANLAEGTGRGSVQDNRRFIRMARGSLYETQHWLRRAYRQDLLTNREIDKLNPIIGELSPKLNAYFRFVDEAVSNKAKQSTKYKAQSSET